MFFSRKAKKGPEAETVKALGVKDVDFADGIVRFSTARFRASDVMVASINRDTVSHDGIGGSVLFKTREFEPDRGIVQKIYKATFDEKAILKVAGFADKIREAGGTVNTLALRDSAFRRAFF